VSKPFTAEQQSAASSSSLYQTFTQKHAAHKIDPQQKSELKHWNELEKPMADERWPMADQQLPTTNNQRPAIHEQELTQLHHVYIVAATRKGIMLIHQQNAHERILFERYQTAIAGKAVATQTSLFPSTLHVSPQDAVMLTEIITDLLQLGYHIEPFGKDTFVIQGTPADVEQGNEAFAIEMLLEQIKHFSTDVKFSKREKLIRSLAQQHSIKAGKSLTQTEMKHLVEDLFQCNQPNTTAMGHPTYTELKKEELDKLFGK
jgi:DNA mismatch repair protein MutL